MLFPTPFRQKSAIFLGILAALVFAFAAPAADSPVLVRGKGVQVTQADLDEAFINLRASMAAQGRAFSEAQRSKVEHQLLEKITLTKILLGKASDTDRSKAKEKVDRLIAEEKAKAKSDSRFEAQIRASGLSPESFQTQLLERATCEEVMDRELRPLLGVTQERVREFYDANASEFRQPERLRFRQIVFTLRSPAGGQINDTEKTERKHLAEKLVTRLRAGEDFAALARQYSDDPAGRERGGEYIFPVGKMIPEFEVAVVGLATNQISDVITTPYSYHVVQVMERMPGQQIPYNDLTNQITLRLELSATQAKLPEYQQRLFSQAGVEFLSSP